MDIKDIWPEWHIEERIGEGAYAKVYRISKSGFGHTSYAAAKIIEIPQDASEVAGLAAQGMDNLSIRSYFEGTARNIINEIAVMESLKGAGNVVGIEDYRLIEHEDGIGWTICIRMELLQSLAGYQKEAGNPDAREAVKIGIDICNALIRCEELGVIHRDVKPENVFRDRFGNYKLGDFGISRQIEMGTRSAAVLSQKGTGPYMAPEVALGQKYGANVDVYSLGIMLYRFLNGMRFPFLPSAPAPFTVADVERAQTRRLSGEPLPPPANAPEELAEIICKACAADPKRRYESAREFQKDLTAWSFKEQFTRDGIGSGTTSVTAQPIEQQVQPAVVAPPASQVAQGSSAQGFGTGAASGGVAGVLQQRPPAVVAGSPPGAQPYVAPLPVKPPIVDPPVSGGDNGQGGRQGNGDGDRSKIKLIVAAACAVVVVVLAVVAMTQFSDCSSGKDSISSSSASESSDVVQISSASGAQNDSQVETPSTKSAIIDLDSQSQYVEVNLFLSNFAEISEFWAASDYDASKADKDWLVDWGFWHYSINNDALQKGDFTLGGKSYACYVDTSGVESSITKYLDITYDLTDYSFSFYSEKDGRLYSMNDGTGRKLNYVALAKQATDVSEDEVEINFVMLTTNNDHGMITDGTWYRMTVDELAAAMKEKYAGDTIREATGTARVAVRKTAAGREFVLREFKMVRGSTGFTAWSNR